MGKVNDAIKGVMFHGTPLFVKLMSSADITKKEIEDFMDAVTNFKLAVQKWKEKGKNTKLLGLKSKEEKVEGAVRYADELNKLIYNHMKSNKLL